MSKVKNYVIPVAFIIGYLVFSFLLMQFIPDKILMTYVSDIVTAIIGIIVIRKFIKYEAGFNLKPAHIVLGLISIFIIWFECQCVSTWLYTFSKDTNFDSYAELVEQHFVEYLILSIVIAPIMEEILMRGIVFGSINKSNKIAAYVVSIGVFTLLHGTITHIPSCVIFGLIFAFLYDMTGNLIVPIVVHILNNLMSVVLSGIKVPAVLLTGPISVIFYFVCLILVTVFILGYYNRHFTEKVK